MDLAEVGEELEGDHVDDVLQRCEAISQSLKGLLGGSNVTDRVSTLDAAPMVSHEALIEACGNAAKYLKRYCCRKNPCKTIPHDLTAALPAAQRFFQ